MESKLAKQKKERHLRWFKAAALVGVFAAVMLLVSWLVGKPLLQIISEPEVFRTWVGTLGYWGQLAFVGLMALQIILAFIPGEPLEIAAGYAFGFWQGTALCMLGAAVGSLVVFLAVRHLGIRVIRLFFPERDITSPAFFQNERKLNAVTFLLFAIPGTPKDLMTYCAGLTQMRLSVWMGISSIARIPSIVTSTVGGDALGMQNYTFAAIVFVITLLVSLAGLVTYRRVCVRKEGSE